jgi:hypothetical protein
MTFLGWAPIELFLVKYYGRGLSTTVQDFFYRI